MNLKSHFICIDTILKVQNYLFHDRWSDSVFVASIFDKKPQLPNGAVVPRGATADLGHCRIFFLFGENTVTSVFHNTNFYY